MNKKSVFIYILGAILFSVFFGYSIVFGAGTFFGNEIKISFKLSNNIYPDSLYLKDNKIAFKSNIDISDYSLISNCNIHSKFISKNNNIYFFNIRFFDSACENKYVFLLDEKGNKILSTKFNIISEYKLYKILIDNKTSKLKNIYNLLKNKQQKLLKYNGNYNKNIHKVYYNYLLNNRILKEISYNIYIIKLILDSRLEKYIIPINKKILPTNKSKLPNSSRGYRLDYTDGIHHGWDFDGNFGEKVFAIDNGIIIRVVSDFNFNDLNKIKRGKNLSDFVKTRNLDILRGNQVWLKTSKGDVAFYSHLSNIYSDIKEGQKVRKGQVLGTIGITGVPDKNYTDYHLHLPIHKNPYIKEKIGKYDYDDYMNWDWYFKGDSLEIVLKKQSEIFE